MASRVLKKTFAELPKDQRSDVDTGFTDSGNMEFGDSEEFGRQLSSYIDKKLAKPFKAANRPVAVTTRGTSITDQMVKEFALASVSQVESLGQEYREGVAQLVADATLRGGTTSLREALTQYSEQVANKAEFYARDLVGDTVSKISASRQQSAGFPGYIWMTSLDSRVRDSHAELHGKYFTWAQQPPGLDKPGAKLPGVDYNCRCTAYPALGEQDQLSDQQRAEDLAEIRNPPLNALTDDPKPYNKNHDIWAKTVSDFPQSEIDVYHDYKLNAHRSINGALRAGAANTESDQFDSFFEKSKVTNRNGFTAYRALPESVIRTFKKGEFFDDAGYASASLHPGIADLFVGSSGRVVTINVPKGAPHIYGMREEMEVILAKGSKIRILEITEDEIKAEYIK